MALAARESLNRKTPERTDSSIRNYLQRSKSFLLLNCSPSTSSEPLTNDNTSHTTQSNYSLDSDRESSVDFSVSNSAVFKKNYYGYHQGVGPLFISVYNILDFDCYQLDIRGIKGFETILIDKPSDSNKNKSRKLNSYMSPEEYQTVLKLGLIEYFKKINLNRVEYLCWFFNINRNLPKKVANKVKFQETITSIPGALPPKSLDPANDTETKVLDNEKPIVAIENSTAPQKSGSQDPPRNTTIDEKLEAISDYVKIDSLGINISDIIASLDENYDADINTQISEVSENSMRKSVLVDMIVLDNNPSIFPNNETISESLKVLDSLATVYPVKGPDKNNISKAFQQREKSAVSLSKSLPDYPEEFKNKPSNEKTLGFSRTIVEFSEADALVARGNIIKEIISTEESYVSKLKYLVEAYAKPLRTSVESMSRESNIAYAVRVIFGNLESLLPVNAKFLSDLRLNFKKVNKTSPAVDAQPNSFHDFPVGKICNYHFKNFIPYERYIAGYSRGIDQSKKLQDTSSFYSTFLSNVSKEKKFPKISFHDLLVMPVQRIPRYDLLLSQLIKATKPESEEYRYLQMALKRIRAIGKLTHDPSVSTYKGLMELHRHKTARRTTLKTDQLNPTSSLDISGLKISSPSFTPTPLSSSLPPDSCDVNNGYSQVPSSSFPEPDYNPLEKPVADSILELYILHSLIKECPPNLISARRTLVGIFGMHEQGLLDCTADEIVLPLGKRSTSTDKSNTRTKSNDMTRLKRNPTKSSMSFAKRNKSFTYLNGSSSRSVHDLKMKNLDFMHSSPSLNFLPSKKKPRSTTILVFSDSLMIVENSNDSLPLFSFNDMFIYKTEHDRDFKQKKLRLLAENHRNKKIATLLTWVSISNIQLIVQKNSTNLSSFYLHSIPAKCKDLSDFYYAKPNEKSRFEAHVLDSFESEEIERSESNKLTDFKNTELLINRSTARLNSWDKISKALKMECTMYNKNKGAFPQPPFLNRATDEPLDFSEKFEKSSCNFKPNNQLVSGTTSPRMPASPSNHFSTSRNSLDSSRKDGISFRQHAEGGMTSSISNPGSSLVSYNSTKSCEKSPSVLFGKNYWYPVSLHKFVLFENQDLSKLEKSINLAKMSHINSLLNATVDDQSTLFGRKNSLDYNSANHGGRESALFDVEIENQTYQYRVWTWEKYHKTVELNKSGWQADATVMFDARNISKNINLNNDTENSTLQDGKLEQPTIRKTQSQKLYIPNLFAWIQAEPSNGDEKEMTYNIILPQGTTETCSVPVEPEFEKLSTASSNDLFEGCLFSADWNKIKNTDKILVSSSRHELAHKMHILLTEKLSRDAMHPARFLERCSFFLSTLGSLFQGLPRILSDVDANNIFKFKDDVIIPEFLQKQTHAQARVTTRNPPYVGYEMSSDSKRLKEKRPNSHFVKSATAPAHENDSQSTRSPSIKSNESKFLLNGVSKFTRNARIKGIIKSQRAGFFSKKKLAKEETQPKIEEALEKVEHSIASPDLEEFIESYFGKKSEEAFESNSTCTSDSSDKTTNTWVERPTKTVMLLDEINSTSDLYNYLLQEIFTENQPISYSVPIFWLNKLSTLNDIFGSNEYYNNNSHPRDASFLHFLGNKFYINTSQDIVEINCKANPDQKNGSYMHELFEGVGKVSVSVASLVSLILLSKSFTSAIPEFELNFHDLAYTAITYFKHMVANSLGFNSTRRVNKINDCDGIAALSKFTTELSPTSSHYLHPSNGPHDATNRVGEADNSIEMTSPVNRFFTYSHNHKNSKGNSIYSIKEILRDNFQRSPKTLNRPNSRCDSKESCKSAQSSPEIDTTKTNQIAACSSTINFASRAPLSPSNPQRTLRSARSQFYDPSIKTDRSDDDFVIVKH